MRGGAQCRERRTPRRRRVREGERRVPRVPQACKGAAHECRKRSRQVRQTSDNNTVISPLVEVWECCSLLFFHCATYATCSSCLPATTTTTLPNSPFIPRPPVLYCTTHPRPCVTRSLSRASRVQTPHCWGSHCVGCCSMSRCSLRHPNKSADKPHLMAAPRCCSRQRPGVAS